MATSDTVVGIVGSIVLVAVMVGVFVYEYNNAPEAEGTDGGDGTNVDEPIMSESASGAIGPVGSNSFGFDMAPGAGVESITIDVTWTPNAAVPVGPGATFNYVITDPDGAEHDAGSASSTSTFVIEPAMDGTWNIEFTNAQGGAGGSFDVTATYTYGSADAEA